MENPNFEIKPSSLVNTLTLRYDNTLSPNMQKKTWRDFLPYNKSEPIEFIEKSICEHIEKKLKNSNEEKISIALSGGIDSTLILSLIKKVRPDIKIEAISVQFADSKDETQIASQIAKTLNVNHNVVFLENYLSELPKAISITKLPFWDLHWYHVVKNAKNHSQILFSGDGGDELFSGYIFRYKKFLSLTSKNSSPSQKIQNYLKCHERDWVDDQEEIFNKKIKFSWNSIHEKLLEYFDNELTPLEQVFLADYNGKLLYNFEPVNSSLSNHFGIKTITPILNEELIEIAPHLPLNYKFDIKNNLGKLPLRKILKKNNLDNLVAKQKFGFSVDTISLWKSYGQNICKKFLLDSRIVQDGWINGQWIEKYIDKSNLDVRYVNKFLGILAFEIWYRLFVSNEISSEDTLD